MKRDEFFKLFIEKNDIDLTVTEETNLNDIDEWDSLASITTIAMFQELGLKITTNDIKNCKTVKDILDLGNEKYE